MKSTRLLLSMAAFTAATVFFGRAQAEDWKPVGQAGYLGTGKAYEIEKGHTYWVGEVAGTFFSDKGEAGLFDHAGVKCPAWADIDSNNKTYKDGGYCTLTDSAGDKAHFTFQVSEDIEHHPGKFDLPAEVTQKPGCSSSAVECLFLADDIY
jgi:hypothetical protein